LPVETRPSAILFKHLVVPTKQSLNNSLPAMTTISPQNRERKKRKNKKSKASWPNGTENGADLGYEIRMHAYKKRGADCD